MPILAEAWNLEPLLAAQPSEGDHGVDPAGQMSSEEVPSIAVAIQVAPSKAPPASTASQHNSCLHEKRGRDVQAPPLSSMNKARALESSANFDPISVSVIPNSMLPDFEHVCHIYIDQNLAEKTTNLAHLWSIEHPSSIVGCLGANF